MNPPLALIRVSDISWSDVCSAEYDTALLASGYEPRCLTIPKRLKNARSKSGRPVVLGFSDWIEAPTRKDHDRYFSEVWSQPVVISGDDQPLLSSILGESPGESVHIVVDYSSMSRLWYSAVLSWARFSGRRRVTLDFVYSAGRYEGVVTPHVIKEILAIPGCEGTIVGATKSVVVFGLGYDSWAPLCVFERLEPDVTIASWAVDAEGRDIARVKNDAFVRRNSSFDLPLPLDSVERTFAVLAETLGQYRSGEDVILIPMGPKPHVLASLCVAMRLPRIQCLRVSTVRAEPAPIEGSGDVVCTRVEFGRSHEA